MADDDTTVLRARARWTLLQIAISDAIVAVVLCPLWFSGVGRSMIVTALVVNTPFVWTSISRRWLAIDAVGIRSKRNSYVVWARWEDVVSFSHRRFLGPVRVMAVELTTSAITRPDGSEVTEKLAAKIRSKQADRFIQIGVYVDDRLSGPFGEALRRHRPDLFAALPSPIA